MGKLSNTVKERTCLVCGEQKQTDSKGLKRHSLQCARAKRAGLVLPGSVIRPEFKLQG